MKNFKSYFDYNKKQRNGIFFLLLIIVSLQLVFFFADFSFDKEVELSTKEIALFQKELDSLSKMKLASDRVKIFSFNPNFISDFKGYQIGMSLEEIDRLHNFRNKGKYVNSAKEFQKITKVGDSLLKIISPHFKFPEWKSSKKNLNKVVDRLIVKKDLNQASESELQVVNGVGVKLSERIIKYRSKLGGFSFNDQIYEVWNLDEDTAKKVLKHFEVVKLPKINKLNVNVASFKEVLGIVYVDYELTKKIFNYRDEVAEIQNLEELKKIEGFPIEKFDRIALYLEAK